MKMKSFIAHFSEPPSINDGHLQIKQQQLAVYDSNTGQRHVQLTCGSFTSLGQPPVSVIWTVSDKETNLPIN